VGGFGKGRFVVVRVCVHTVSCGTGAKGGGFVGFTSAVDGVDHVNNVRNAGRSRGRVAILAG